MGLKIIAEYTEKLEELISDSEKLHFITDDYDWWDFNLSAINIIKILKEDAYMLGGWYLV